MATHNYAPLFGRRLRVTQVGGDGAPGPQQFVTEGFVSVSLQGVTEDGAEILLRNAQNQLCINEQLSSTFKRLNVSVRFCGVNPLLLSWMSNAELYEDYAGDAAGFTLGEGEIDGTFALELFTGLAGSLNDTNANGYALLPFVKAGTIADLEFTGEDAVDFTIQNMLSQSGNAWGAGPYDVVMDDSATPVAAPLPTALDPKTHFLLIDTAVAAPAATPEPIAIPA
jgi:hypothetical protein